MEASTIIRALFAWLPNTSDLRLGFLLSRINASHNITRISFPSLITTYNGALQHILRHVSIPSYVPISMAREASVDLNRISLPPSYYCLSYH